MPPRLVIFDMDDVLCHYDLGRRLRALSRLTAKTPRDIRAAIWDSGFEGDSDAGGYPDPEQYLAEFSRRIGHELSRAEWIDARKQSMTPDFEVLELAQAIGRSARLAIYSNNGPLVKLHFADLFPEAAAIFSECFCSYEFATKKPDPASFTRLLDRIKVAPAEAWFIDDKRSNVRGAVMAGLAGHHFRSYRALLGETRSLGLVP